MNKNIKLAVAGAVLALSASAANAGIVIPAGDWTLDVNGNVNAFANMTKFSGSATEVVGGINGRRQTNEDRTQGINTGLLPSWLGFTGKTRQNDLDVEFTISFQPNVSDQSGAVHGDSLTPLNRQSYLSFGDKSWGSFKLGKDIGIFASDAILNDMTLLGVGAGAANSGGATTLGGIGTGYIYAGWKGQVAYTTPNFNGFQATVGIVNPNQIAGGDAAQSVARLQYQDRFGVEGKASYAFSANDVTGKVWVSGASYDVTYADTRASYKASAADIGANVNVAGFGLTGYYYKGDGAGTTLFGAQGSTSTGGKRDSDGGYVQATYILPTKTKIGLAYGISSLDAAGGETPTTLVKDNERYTVGLYHPLTKHLNLVAEYNDVEAKAHNGTENKARSGSLGAILFF
jgi:predicted porin